MGKAKKYSYSVIPEQEGYRFQTFDALVRSADFAFIRAAEDLRVPEVAAALLSYQLPHRWLLEHSLDGAFAARQEGDDKHIVFDLSISELNQQKEMEREHIYPGVAVLQDGHITPSTQNQVMSDCIVVSFLSDQAEQWGRSN